MKNIFKIIFILCLGIFVVAGCADDSGGGNSGANMENTGDGGNTGEVYTPEFTKLISLGGLSYGETVDGKRYVWGNAGELAGAGNKDEVTTPVEVDFTINKILDNDTKYVLTNKGLYAWGDNENGQVGNGDWGYEKTEDGEYILSKPKRVLTPHKVERIDGNIKEVITGDTVYVLTDKGLYAWGSNNYGQVGNGNTEKVIVPHKVTDGNIKDFIMITYKYNDINHYDYITSCNYYILTDNGFYSWGNNEYGQVGNGDWGYEKDEDGNDNYSKPKKVSTPHKVEGIYGNIKELKFEYEETIHNPFSDGLTVYATTDNGLYAWGHNGYGQVGNGEAGFDETIMLPKRVLTPYKTVDGNIKEFIISGSDYNAKYVITDTGFYRWHNTDTVFSSDGNTPDKAVEGSIKDFIISGYYNYYVLTDTGLYHNNKRVRGIIGNINDIKINDGSIYVITDTGIYAWGNNDYGQIGNGTTIYVSEPYKTVDGNIKNFIILDFGYSTTLYALTDTGIYAWGNNDYGQIGNGATHYNVTRPYRVVSDNIKDFVIAGLDSSAVYYALTEDGLYAWGINEFGQVGNGTTAYRVLTPYKVKIKKQN